MSIVSVTYKIRVVQEGSRNVRPRKREVTTKEKRIVGGIDPQMSVLGTVPETEKEKTNK